MTTRSVDISSLPHSNLLIGNERLSGSGELKTHFYAADGKPTGDVHLAGVDDVDAAVHAARMAMPAWRSMDPEARRQIILQAAQLLLERADRLAELATVDCGLTRASMHASVAVAAEWLTYYAGWIDKLGGQVVPTSSNAFDYVRLEPYGVIGVIIPWNGPISAAGMIIGPALAAGNCIVLKPSELTPYVVAEMAQTLTDAGLPAGVVNVVPGGAETGQALVRHPGIDKVHFTGSGKVAIKVLESAAALLKPCSLELGGKSANLVFADADLGIAADVTIRALVRQAGQSCVAGTRILVHESIADELLNRSVQLLSAIRVGDPMMESNEIGPVISFDACSRITGIIEHATTSGMGTLAFGGHRIEGELSGGYFIAPTIFADVDSTSPLAQEETFGPVISFIRFHDDDEAIAIANATDFGLAAYIQTTNLSRAHRVAQELDAGIVWVNGTRGIPAGGPFGGTKSSGFGRLGGEAGLLEFLQTKNVWIGL
jgi:acyl-CoA reductase-like NAD-dependent aldehyde dehydrogenase